MGLYLSAYKFGLLEELAYPVEIAAYIIRKLINLGFLILFWFVISSTNPDIFTFQQMVSYFLISESVKDLAFITQSRFGRNLQKMIKDGTLSNQLIKPVSTLKFLYVQQLGSKTSVRVYALITLAISIFLYRPTSVWGYILFLISLVLTTFVGYGMNIYIGMLAFYSPEPRSIRNVFEHIKRILSGALIPLSYFPPLARTIAEMTPFPVLSYYPAVILQTGDLNIETFAKLGISLFWAIVLVTSAKYFWKKSLRNYDGVGI